MQILLSPACLLPTLSPYGNHGTLLAHTSASLLRLPYCKPTDEGHVFLARPSNTTQKDVSYFNNPLTLDKA